jgi:hypothetical protein
MEIQLLDDILIPYEMEPVRADTTGDTFIPKSLPAPSDTLLLPALLPTSPIHHAFSSPGIPRGSSFGRPKRAYDDYAYQESAESDLPGRQVSIRLRFLGHNT